MFSKNEHLLSNDDKLDYVYRVLKTEEKDRIASMVWKWLWRAVLIASLFWMYLNPSSMADLTKSLIGSSDTANLQRELQNIR